MNEYKGQEARAPTIERANNCCNKEVIKNEMNKVGILYRPASHPKDAATGTILLLKYQPLAPQPFCIHGQPT